MKESLERAAGLLLMMKDFMVVFVVLAKTAVVVVLVETVAVVFCSEDYMVVVLAKAVCGAEGVLAVVEGAKFFAVVPEESWFESLEPKGRVVVFIV